MARPSLEDLLAEFLERREAGESTDAATFAAEHPDAGPELLAALRRVTDTDDLLPSAGAAAAPPHIDGMAVRGELGRGGMGRVYLVADPTAPDRRLAVKVLHRLTGAGPRALQRLRREGEALAALDHPNIVHVHAVGTHQGHPYLLMEHVAGGSLADRIQRARQGLADSPRASRADLLDLPGTGPGWQRACSLVAALARAVAAAHAQGVLHRDLKPANVLLRQADGAPVLIDFGLARCAEASTLTATGDVIGTPHFMAPEQARGEPADQRTDVHGLGAILFELLTLEPPHPGDDAAVILDAVRRTPPRPVRNWDPTLPRAVDLVVRRATALRPARRHRSALELALTLEALAAGGRPARLTLGPLARAEDLWLWHRRGVLAVLAACLLLLGAFWAVQVWRGHRTAQIAAAQHRLLVDYLAERPGPLQAALTALQELAADAPLARFVAAVRDQTPAQLPADDWHRALLAGENARRAQQPRQAMAHFRTALDARPGDPLATALLGIAAAAARDHDLAQRELTAASRMLPESTRLLSELAWVQRHRNDLAEAERLLRAAIAIDADDPDLWHDLARMLARLHRGAEGLLAVERAIDLRPGDPPALYLRTQAALLHELGRADEAIPIFARIARDHPSPSHCYSLAATLDSAHRVAEARDAYQRALELDPDHVPALLALAHLHSGSRHECPDCAVVFAAQPELFDPDLTEAYALRALAADDGHGTTALLADYVTRVQRADRFRAELDRMLQQDRPEQALGRLLKARRVLDAR